MRPLKLSIEGIKSFTDRQEIDFAALSENRLFGIFGDTASGKSTILSSMILALYGEDDGKVHQRDFINMNRNDASVTLDFMINSGGTPTAYRCERSFRIRESGTYDNKARLLLHSETGYIVIEDTIKGVDSHIENLIGLSLAEFKKCVILPQGEFASFLKATPAERLQIIGKLFDLEKYGDVFFAKVRDYRSQRMAELSLAQNTIGVVGDFDYREIDAQTQLHKQLLQRQQLLEKEYENTKQLLAKMSRDAEIIQQYNDAIKQQERLLQQQPNIQQIELQLKRNASARLVMPYIKAHTSAESDLQAAQNKFKEASLKLKDIDNKHNQAATAVQSAKKDYDDNFIKDNQQIATLKALRPNFAEIADIDNKLKTAREQYQIENTRLQKLNKDIQQYNTKIQQGDKSIQELEQLLAQDEKLLHSASQASYYTGRAEEAQYASDTLQDSEQRQHFSIRAQKFTKDAQDMGKSDGVLSQEKRILMQKQIALLRSSGQDFERERTALLQSSAAAQEKLKNIESDGKQQRQRQQDIQKRLNDGGAKALSLTEFDALVQKLTLQNQNRQQLKEKLENELTALDKQRQGVAQEQAVADGDIKTHLQSVQKQQKLLEDELKTQGFSSRESCQSAIIDSTKSEDLQKQCKQFNDVMVANNANIQKLKPVFDKIDLKEQDLLQLQESYKSQDAEIKGLVKSASEVSGLIAILTERRQKLDIAKKQVTQLKEQLDTAEKLYNLTKGKRFMEFAAEEFICGITNSATEHINRLSAGRYRLIYEQGGFFVEDNYSGGANRKVITLSGGETFLVSLSLAVALSEAIAKRSEKAMEFFFLDEGFGTLDNELCDMVMQSLERLRQSHFTIGLISHVPELRHRLDFKLDVTAPTDTTGSKVTHVRP